jgi:hypothetical protein
MDGYHIALFVHLIALVAASAAAALTHFAEGRCRRAATVTEALHWHELTGSVAKVFPIAILTLLATGGFMVGNGRVWSWSAGWVDAGITGAVLLFVIGGVLGARGRVAGRELARLAAESNAGQAPGLRHDPLVPLLSWMNTGLAIGVVFVMTTKPPLTGALLVLAVAAAAGAALGAPRKRAEALATEMSAG